MATIKGFDKYVIRISGGNVGRVGLLLCYGGNSFVGRIDFYPDGASEKEPVGEEEGTP